jgi:hypothetical protein
LHCGVAFAAVVLNVEPGALVGTDTEKEPTDPVWLRDADPE